METGGLLGHFVYYLGPLEISGSLLTSWLVTVVLALLGLVSTRRLQMSPGKFQVVLEGIVTSARDAVAAVLPDHVDLVFPFIATLWGFILAANLIGLVPGMSSPTADLSVTAALAVLVFLSVHWFGVQADGVIGYLKHYLAPSPLLLPFHLISEISRTLALAIRLFGNVMSLEIAALMCLMIAGFLVPIPLLMLHIVEAVIQAYLFGMLALIYIAGGIQSQELRKQNLKKGEIA